MKKFKVQSTQVIEISAWCIDTFGPSYTMPHWWRCEKNRDFPLEFAFEFFDEADAVLYALRWG